MYREEVVTERRVSKVSVRCRPLAEKAVLPSSTQQSLKQASAVAIELVPSKEEHVMPA